MIMSPGHEVIAEAAAGLAGELPHSLIGSLAEAIRGCNPDFWQEARTRILGRVSHAHYRDLADRFLGLWRVAAPGLSPQAVALALVTAAHSVWAYRERQAVEIAWTGPEAESTPFRRTEQAILQVLDSARRRITLVSYAVYNIPHIAESVIRAAGRGVRITIIVESAERREGWGAYDTLRALGDQVSACSTVYLWPRDHRPVDEAGKHGILHVKCAVADGQWLFLSSANLTEYAFTINMELGVLISGGPLPRQVEAHFDRLIARGDLTPI